MKNTHFITGVSIGLFLAVITAFAPAAQAAGINPLSEARSDVFAVLNMAHAGVSFRFGDDFVSTLGQRPAVEHFVFTEGTAVGAGIRAGDLLLALYE